MKIRALFLLATFIFTAASAAPTAPDVMKKRMLADLEFIKNTFEVKYAPFQWKKEHVGWELERAYIAAKKRIEQLPTSNIASYHTILKEFFNSMKDYHVCIVFYSTEESFLPFKVQGAEDRYFVVEIDRSHLTDGSLELGDEILTMDGVSLSQKIKRLKEEELGDNVLMTDMAIAEILLTRRTKMLGHYVPRGDVNLSVRKKSTGKVQEMTLHWFYSPEKIRDPLDKKVIASPKMGLIPEKKSQSKMPLEFFNKQMIAQKFFDKDVLALDSRFDIGAKKSFIPTLGKKVWEHEREGNFFAYIFEKKDHHNDYRIGYLRIPHYMGGEWTAAELEGIISHFEGATDGLIIDQIHNPGGSAFFLYAIASMLTTQPLKAPQHRLTLTQQEVAMAATILECLNGIYDDDSAQEVLGETLSGYAIDFEFVKAMEKFCRFIIREWEAGNTYTDPIHLFGMEEIHPHPRTQYTKPILVLIDQLDFSCADFFAAIMQDNHRGHLLGTRTAGAGGYIATTQFPNQTGIVGFQMTASLAVRPDETVLENLGVTPDTYYKLSIKDIQENYADYSKAILKQIKALIK